jgi:hypothetical protein
MSLPQPGLHTESSAPAANVTDIMVDRMFRFSIS